MNTMIAIGQRNKVLQYMAQSINTQRAAILKANAADMDAYKGGDLAMRDRLYLSDAKIDGMIVALSELALQADPLGVERYHFTHENGMQVSNRTAPFGTVMIIYESRPDVTIEAAGIAFKSGNKILLKGGKEAFNSNDCLVKLWHEALEANGLETGWITYLRFNREETRAFLRNPTQRIDLIVPRGGEKLIGFVKTHASCPVIVSGRGNNFLFVDAEADREMAAEIVLNAKVDKISACNALDKVLIHADFPRCDEWVDQLIRRLKEYKVEIMADDALADHEGVIPISDEGVWHEEFLDYKIVLGRVRDMDEAISKINTYGGGHSSSIITEDREKAMKFMDLVDCAAVYHNASTRFTDGGQFGLGGELAISTDKLHQRGPIGLRHLTTNKWYVMGKGHIRQ